MSKLLVKVQNAVFPLRIHGERYQNGDELEIDEKHYTSNVMKIVAEAPKEPPNPDNELEGKSVEELQAYVAENNIDIGNATSVNGIIKKIKEATEKTE